MSMTERSEILEGIYRLNAETGQLLARCQQARALQLGVSLAAVQNILTETLDDLRPDVVDYAARPDNLKLTPGKE